MSTQARRGRLDLAQPTRGRVGSGQAGHAQWRL